MTKLFLILIVGLFPMRATSQTTPEQLGNYLFKYLKEGSLSKIDSLVPTLNEMKALAEKIGIKKDSKQYSEAINGYSSELDKFHKTINGLYSDTLDNRLNWQNAHLEKVISFSDSMKIDEKDPKSISVLVTRLSVYIESNSQKFRITIDDAFEVNGLWKLGNNIYLKESTE